MSGPPHWLLKDPLMGAKAPNPMPKRFRDRSQRPIASPAPPPPPARPTTAAAPPPPPAPAPRPRSRPRTLTLILNREGGSVLVAMGVEDERLLAELAVITGPIDLERLIRAAGAARIALSIRTDLPPHADPTAWGVGS